jgi:hypothetical protein
MLTQNRKLVLSAAANATVEIYASDIRDVARTNPKTGMALTLYQQSEQSRRGATQFLNNCRTLFDPDPAHMVDCVEADPNDYMMLNYIPHSFAMDGERCEGQKMREISSPLALLVAMHTYPRVKQMATPCFFTVSMTERVYHRAMFPFRALPGDGPVAAIVTLVEPILHLRRLSDLLH